MYRYLWEADYDNGLTVHRFTPDGQEQVPDPWRTRQFRLYSLTDATAPSIHVHVPRGAYFTFAKTRYSGDRQERETVYIVAWHLPDAPHGFELHIHPDNTIEISH